MSRGGGESVSRATAERSESLARCGRRIARGCATAQGTASTCASCSGLLAATALEARLAVHDLQPRRRKDALTWGSCSGTLPYAVLDERRVARCGFAAASSIIAIRDCGRSCYRPLSILLRAHSHVIHSGDLAYRVSRASIYRLALLRRQALEQPSGLVVRHIGWKVYQAPRGVRRIVLTTLQGRRCE